MNQEKSLAEILVEYAISQGAKDISQLEGLWTHTIDEHWTIKCNGHLETIDGVSPFCWVIDYNGFPAGVIDFDGYGAMCAGEDANEKALREAIEARMKDLKRRQR